MTAEDGGMASLCSRLREEEGPPVLRWRQWASPQTSHEPRCGESEACNACSLTPQTPPQRGQSPCSACVDQVVQWVPRRSYNIKPFFRLFRSKISRRRRRFRCNWHLHRILYCLSSSSVSWTGTGEKVGREGFPIRC